MSGSEPRSSIECRSYSAGRKHPLVIGKIGGHTLPFPLTPTQFIAGGVALLFMVVAVRRPLAAVTPSVITSLIIMAVPVGTGWAVRHLRIEGRSPMQMILGLVSLATSPRNGTANGKPVKTVRAQTARAKVWVTQPDGTADLLEVDPSATPVPGHQIRVPVVEHRPAQPKGPVIGQNRPAKASTNNWGL